MRYLTRAILATFLAIALCVPIPAAAQTREPRPKDPKGDTGTRPPREKPNDPSAGTGDTRPPRETGAFVPNDYEAPIRQPGGDYTFIDNNMILEDAPWVEPIVLRSSANPLMDVYQLTIATAIVTNASTLSGDGGVPAFGAAGIVIGMVSLAVAPTRATTAQRAGFIAAGLASILFGAFNLDDGASVATTPYTSAASTTLLSISF